MEGYMMKKGISLSKSLYMEGLRCLKLLWLRHRPDLVTPSPPDPQTQHLFDTGHKVGELAHQLFPGGRLIGNGHPQPFYTLLQTTEAALSGEAPSIYEGAFSNGNTHCRVDVLERIPDAPNTWNLHEVKMSSKLKISHVDDCAFQAYCVSLSGITIPKIFLIRVNSDYTRQGDLDISRFFTSKDITSDVRREMLSVPFNVLSMIETIQREAPPKTLIGGHCKTPGLCPFYEYCHNSIPSGSVYELPFGNRLIPKLINAGITRLADIPKTTPLSTRQAALVESAKTGLPVINKVAIREHLHTLKYPFFFLDFETASPCIPVFNDSSPYERLSFQYSVHVRTSPYSILEHFEFLPDNPADPRAQLIERLISILGNEGSIIVYHEPFERSVLLQLKDRFPIYADRIERIIQRLFDLIIPFKSGSYSDVRFAGSASIKKVLPVMVPSMSYANMPIARGDEASLAYEKLISGEIGPGDWQHIREDLSAYCKLDTDAMASILNVLSNICNGGI
jgi:hypothetical protein